MEKIAIYGKGGIGKSVVATNLSACYGLAQKRVIHIGCDPKHDSAIRLSDNPGEIKTVLEILGNNPNAEASGRIINKGRHGIDLIEAGGPTAGLGCAGRGVARTLETLDDLELFESDLYEMAIFDVLGDVVCGGFAAPLRSGFAQKVYIVVSEEPMALFAANNIAKAVLSYQSNGVCLGGLVANLRNNENPNIDLINDFAKAINTDVVEVIPRSPLILKAEQELKTVVEYAPDSEIAAILNRLATKIEQTDKNSVQLPTPMEDNAFFEFLQQGVNAS